MAPLRITPKRLRLALRSPRHLLWAMRYALRNSPLGALERRMLRGYSLRPNQIIVNITGRCNLRCAMCMQPRGAPGDDDSPTFGAGAAELEPQQWLRVVDQAAPARPAFYFSGGEPLLYRGLDAILERVKSHGMIAALVTNATLLEKHARRLVEIGVDNVTVSIDGPAQTHDAIRGLPGAFDRAMRGIGALVEARRAAGAHFPSLKINCVVTPDSLPHLEETWRIAADLGADEINFQHPIFDTTENLERHNRVFPSMLGLDAEEARKCCRIEGEIYSRRFTEGQVDELLETARRIEAQSGPESPAVLFFPEVPRAQWPAYYLDLQFPFRALCTMPWRIMRLQADGAFEPCLHYRIGNVADAPLWELWNAAAMRRFRRALAAGRLFPGCVRCCYRNY